MTERQKKIKAYEEMLSKAYASMSPDAYRAMAVEAYKELVGEEMFDTKKEEVSPAGLYPVLRSHEPRLKPDREQFKGIVPKFANAQLPAVEYNAISW